MKAKYKKLKYVTKGKLIALFNTNETTKDLATFVYDNFKKNATDCADFQELNKLMLERLADKRTKLQKACELHAQMLYVASLKGQKLAVECIRKLTEEYEELYLIYRKFIKLFPALRCPLENLCQVDKSSDDYPAFIEEANTFFKSILD